MCSNGHGQRRSLRPLAACPGPTKHTEVVQPRPRSVPGHTDQSSARGAWATDGGGEMGIVREPVGLLKSKSPTGLRRDRTPHLRPPSAQPPQEATLERSKPRATSPSAASYDAVRPPSTAAWSAKKIALDEAAATMQASHWPYTLGSMNMSGKVVHAQAPPHLFSNRTSTTTRYGTDAPHMLYTSGALAAADKSGRKHSWHGTSLAHQRYQYHMLLSHVALKLEEDEPNEEGKINWTEAGECTGGSKTDTLLPGSSNSNSLRWPPLPVGHLADLRPLDAKWRAAAPERCASTQSRSSTPSGVSSGPMHLAKPLKRLDAVPLTASAFVDMSRKDKEARRQARERRRIFEHAKKQGVEDVESWLESLEANKSENPAAKANYSNNRWSSNDKHRWLAVSDDGLTVTPSYTGTQYCNGLVRAKQGFWSGRHYWEITLDRFSVNGEGWHCIGVADPEVPLQGNEGQIVMGASQAAACLYLENCQKMRASGRPLEYGKRAVKQGDVIGVLLDLDLGELSFFLNGNDMGVAFYGMRGPLFPAVEMGMMVGQQHAYTANFSAKAPPRRKLEAPPPSDEEAFRDISCILPMTSMKYHGEGFGAILSVPSTMPHEAPGGIHYRVSNYPQMGEYLMHGATGQPKPHAVTPLNRTVMDNPFER